MCIYSWMKQWGRYGHSCLWFSIQVIWTKRLSYYILLQKGFYESYRPPKAINAVADCLLYSVSHSWEALPSAVLRVAISLLKHRGDVSVVYIQCVEEEGAHSKPS